MSERLTTFQGQSVEFVESMVVTKGVVCDVYQYVEDDTCDLGIVTVQAGCKTPLQKVLKGEKTIEGRVSGSATLVVKSTNGEVKKYSYPDTKEPTVVQIGEIVQWHADNGQDLVFYEICYPPYQDGRFENLTEEG